jgi:TrmH family RNA methyltransferase
MEEITSAQNPSIKLVHSLAARKHRQATGLFVVEGLDHARKAKANGFIPHLLLLDRHNAADPALHEIIAWVTRAGARTAALPAALMSRISGLSNPQALILACRQQWCPADVRPDGTATVLALDRIRDPGNLGTIIRTAEAAAVTRLHLIGDSCDPFSSEAVRASAGSIFAMKMSRLAQDDFLQIVRTWPGDVVGTHLAAAESFKQPYARPVLLLMGSESHGLPQELASVCTRLVRIPMAGSVESLNVAAATALMLYELQLPLLHSKRP